MILPVPLDAVPDLLHEAVGAVPEATVIEVRPDGAVLGHRTNFAARAEHTVLMFSAVDSRGTEVIVARTGRDGWTYPRSWGSAAQNTSPTIRSVLGVLRDIAADAADQR